MILSEIYIYPVKSAKGVILNEALIEQRGLQFDRRWMVVDEAGVFISQRKYPRLALICTHVDSGQLQLTAPGMNTLHIPVIQKSGVPFSVQVWDDVVQAVSADEGTSSWFSKFLGFPCRLVFMPDNSLRAVNPGYAKNSDIVSFADGFPLLLISQASLDDLNRRLAAPVRMNRFRPNIVVKDCGAYDEDRWKEIRIGEVTLHIVKPCSRCVTTTIDQGTATQGKEPLATLSQYRNVDGKVFFGQNAIPEKKGVIRTGDPIEVIS